MNNQQERLIKLGWIKGFVDGEGCFSISLIKQNNRKEKNRMRKGYKTGYQIFHEFAVTQGAKSLNSLEALKKFFGVGNIYVNKRHDNHHDNLYRYVVRKRDELTTVIIPFFKTNKLLTSKNENFEKFAQCVEMTANKEHLTLKGLKKIISIANLMNRKKKRKI